MTAIEFLKKAAKATLLEQGYHVPQLNIFSEQGRAFILLPNFPNEYEQKIQAMLTVGRSLGMEGEIENIDEVYLVMEAWVSKNVGVNKPYVRPKDDPQRIEALVIAGRNEKEQKDVAVCFEMKRGEQGKLIGLEDLLKEENEAMTAKSPLMEAFFYGFAKGKAMRYSKRRK